MSVYVVAIHLQSPWEDYGDLREALRKLDVMMPNEVYGFVFSQRSADQICTMLAEHLGPGDEMFVGALHGGWATMGDTPDLAQWLNVRMTTG